MKERIREAIKEAGEIALGTLEEAVWYVDDLGEIASIVDSLAAEGVVHVDFIDGLVCWGPLPDPELDRGDHSSPWAMQVHRERYAPEALEL